MNDNSVFDFSSPFGGDDVPEGQLTSQSGNMAESTSSLYEMLANSRGKAAPQPGMKPVTKKEVLDLIQKNMGGGGAASKAAGTQFTPYKWIGSRTTQAAIQEIVDDLESPAAESGADLIANADRSIATIADLQAYPKPSLPAGRTKVITVLEYATNTGVGGGQFRWQANSNQTADNALVVNPTGNAGTGRWIRIYDGPAQASFWGATGDGTTNDTAALQAAFTWATGRSAKLTIPEGTYNINASLTIPGGTDGFLIAGASREGTVIRQSSDNVPNITFTGDLTNNFQLGQFTLSHTNPQTNPTLTGCGIYYDLPGTTGNGIFNAHYFDIFFVNCGRGFMSNPGKSFPVWGSVFERIYGQRGNTGAMFYFRPSPAQGQPNNCFRDIYIFANNIPATEFAFIDTNAQDSFEMHNIEVNEAQLGAKYARITESVGVIGSMKLETATYSQGGNVILCELSNSRIDIGHLLFAVTDITNGTNLFCLSPAGGAGVRIGIGNLQYGYTFTRTAPTSGTFTALNATAQDKITVRSVSNPRALGYSSATRLLDNISTSTADGVSITEMLDPKISADIGDANYTIAAYSPVTILNYASARTASRTISIPANSDNDIFNGLSYTLLVGTASAHTINFGGVYTFPASKTGSVTITYRRSAWVVTNAYIV